MDRAIRLHEKPSFMMSRFRCTGKLATKDDSLSNEGIKDSDSHTYACCFQPTEWTGDFLSYTKQAFGLPEKKVILKHRLEEAILAKVVRDCPWAREQLVRIEVRTHGVTGQWDKGWIIFFWKTLKYCRAFLLVSTATSVEPSPTGDPWHLTVTADGNITVHTRYDFYLRDSESATSSTFLWGALGDP
eukprot:1059284-Rhodomonas_salina.1